MCDLKIISKWFPFLKEQKSIIKYTLLTVLLLSFFSQNIQSQTKYLVKNEEWFDFVLNVDINDNTISGYTRKNALLDYASKINYKALKLVTSLKHPEIINFNASLRENMFEGRLDYLFSSYKISGSITQDSLFFSLLDEDNKLYKSFIASRITSCTRKDYGKIAEAVIKTTEENIFNPRLLQSKKWNSFTKKFRQAADKIADDLEFQIGFFALIRNFDFSHYYIVKNTVLQTEIKDTSTLTEIDENTVLLKIGTFFEKAENIKPLLDTIKEKQYSNLIIDIRDNLGGYFEPAALVANFLTDETMISGFFPSRKWYEEFNRFPDKKDINNFSNINGDSIQTHSEYGFIISTNSSGKKYNGNVYLLVNRKTGSTAEALTIGLKEYNLAKIVGEKTIGGLLSVQQFKLGDDIVLYVPVNDFISYGGYRVDKKGIKPDIKTKKGKELEKVIAIINK